MYMLFSLFWGTESMFGLSPCGMHLLKIRWLEQKSGPCTIKFTNKVQPILHSAFANGGGDSTGTTRKTVPSTAN